MSSIVSVGVGVTVGIGGTGVIAKVGIAESVGTTLAAGAHETKTKKPSKTVTMFLIFIRTLLCKELRNCPTCRVSRPRSEAQRVGCNRLLGRPWRALSRNCLTERAITRYHSAIAAGQGAHNISIISITPTLLETAMPGIYERRKSETLPPVIGDHNRLRRKSDTGIKE